MEVQTQGSRIQNVTLKIRRRVSHRVTARIPIGTFFVSRNSASQNMVGTALEKQILLTDEWVTVSIPAACANRPRDIPGRGDSFTITRAPRQKELEKIVPALKEANASYAVRQAAVWIITDNADYGDLGILLTQRGNQAFGGTRTINEKETAQAMKILSEAGINLKKKVI